MVLWLNSTPARPGEITAVELSGRVVRRSGFLPLPGGINQTRATPRGVFHGQGPWNNGVTQKGTFWGGVALVTLSLTGWSRAIERQR